MKVPLPILLPLCISVGFAAHGITVSMPAPVSDDALLSAIAAVETGNHASRVGRAGERSQLQILPSTWREFSRLPHAAAATHPEETNRVARAYLGVIRGRLKARGLPETPFFIAACWNAGPDWRRLSRGTISYAERVANLAEVYQPKPAPTRLPAPSRAPAPTLMPLKPVPVIAINDAAPRGFLAVQTNPLFRLAASN